jgi:hypothetical protein
VKSITDSKWQNKSAKGWQNKSAKESRVRPARQASRIFPYYSHPHLQELGEHPTI